VTDGLTAIGLRRLRAVAEQYVGDDRVPGLVALVARDDQVHRDIQAAACAALG
jgi:hypothetical protein